MMLGSRIPARLRVPAIAAALSPLVVVQAVRLIASNGPSHAGASVVQPLSAGLVTVEAPPPPSPAQAKAMAWIRGLDLSAEVPDPFAGLKAEPVAPAPTPVAQPTPAPAPVVPLAPAAPPTFVVSSMMGAGSTALATINHAVCRVGAEVAPGWTLTRVDARARSVVLRHTDGREIEVSASPK